METERNDSLTQLSVLLTYKKLAEDPENHANMGCDRKTINFLALALNSSDREVLKTSLDTLGLLCESSSSRSAIQSSSEVSEALTTIVNVKNLEHPEFQQKAEKILQCLAITDSKMIISTKTNQFHGMKVLTLHIHGLHLETQKELEDILMKKMKGVHSVIVDVEHQKCTLTVYEHIDPKSVAKVISDNTEMKAKLVTKNKCNQEILVPLTDNDKTIDLSDLPSYLDEKDSPVKEKAVWSAKDFRITASEWFCSAAGFLQRTLYC